MNANADPIAVLNLTYSVCAQVRTLGPRFMATFAAISDYRIKQFVNPGQGRKGNAALAAHSLTSSTSSQSS